MAETPVAHPRAKGFLAVGIVFALGIVFGAALAVVVLRFGHNPPSFGRRHDGHGRFMNRMVRELDLDAQQQEQIRVIIERSQTEVHGVLERTHEELLTLLRPDQREKFDRLHPPGSLPRFPHHRRER